MPYGVKEIQRLTGQSTYVLWRNQITAAHGRKGVWSHVEDRVPEPIKESGELESEFRNRQEEHEMDASNALVLLEQSLPKSILMDVQHLETAFDVWQHLKKKFEPPGHRHTSTRD